MAETFREALSFFQSALYCDVDEELLAYGGVDDPMIPLPTSNSRVAKQMRVVAGLMVCGKALAEHVFRFAFVTRGDELDQALCRLANENPRQEAYLRAVLQKVLPDEQKVARARGIHIAIQEITSAVGPWVQNVSSFTPGLEQLCEKAGRSWDLVLVVEDRITPDFDFRHAEEWLPLPITNGPTSSGPGLPNQNKPQLKSSKQQQNTPAVGPASEKLTRNKVAKVIWPMFFAAGTQDPGDDADSVPFALLHQGYVLAKAQIQGTEVSNEESSHRAVRQSLRRSQSTAQKKRRNSGVFPSAQCSGGAGSK